MSGYRSNVIHLICFPAMASEPQTPAQTIDYNFAREELMLNELSNDPIQAAIARLEKQHEEDKQGKILKIMWKGNIKV